MQLRRLQKVLQVIILGDLGELMFRRNCSRPTTDERRQRAYARVAELVLARASPLEARKQMN